VQLKVTATGYNAQDIQPEWESAFDEKFKDFAYETVPEDMDVPIVYVKDFIRATLQDHKQKILERFPKEEVLNGPDGSRPWVVGYNQALSEARKVVEDTEV